MRHSLTLSRRRSPSLVSWILRVLRFSNSKLALICYRILYPKYEICACWSLIRIKSFRNKLFDSNMLAAIMRFVDRSILDTWRYSSELVDITTNNYNNQLWPWSTGYHQTSWHNWKLNYLYVAWCNVSWSCLKFGWTNTPVLVFVRMQIYIRQEYFAKSNFIHV